MDIGKVFTDGVIIRERHRPLDEGKVEHLAESLRELGLQQPISIWVEGEGSPVLVAGRHRLEAARKLGWEQIDCIFVGLDETEREMWEIAENLHRSELTALERSEHVARYASLIEAKRAQVAQVYDKGGRGNKGGDAEAARTLDISRDDVRRSKAVASLSDEAKAAAVDAGLDDNRSAMLEAAKADPSQQVAVIRTIAEKRQADRNSIDRDVKARAAKEVAEMLSEHVPGDWWDALKANLYAAGAANIAHEFTNITGQSLMDRRYGG